jgi:hypothetical protein
MRGATPPLPSTPSWRGAQLKYLRDNFTFNFLVIFHSINIFSLDVRKQSSKALEVYFANVKVRGRFPDEIETMPP